MNTKLLLLSVLFGTLLVSRSRADMPAVGDVAPAFTGTNQDGQTVRLSDYAGKKLVLLYFYPKDDTSGCTAEACGFRDRMSRFQTNNLVVIGVSFDSAEKHRKFIAEHQLNFTLLADPEGQIVNAYDVKMPFLKLANRVSFLIGTDGRILHVTDAMNPATHFREIQAALDALPDRKP